MVKKVFTTGEVADLLGVNINTVIKWFDKGEIQGFRLPASNGRRIPISGLRHFMALYKVPMDMLNDFGFPWRMHHRVRCQEPASFSMKNGKEYGPYSASLTDVSEGGARILVADRDDLTIPVGDFDLSLSITGGILSGAQWKGKIVHIRSGDKALSMGMKFTELDPTQKQLLADFIFKHPD